MVAGATVLLAAGIAPSPAGAVEGSYFASMGKASSRGGGVVSSRHREASQAGLEILNGGGNAMDAAAATMFAAGVASFESCGIGGGGFLVYRTAAGETAALDFREWSPATYAFTDGATIETTSGRTYAWGTGHNVVGIPGAVAGMQKALDRFGTRTLADVLAPGERLARDGFTVERATAALMKDPLQAARLSAFPNTARQYLPAVLAEAAGQKFRLPELADDYAELRKLGARAFYDPELEGGTIADDLLAEMARPSAYQGDKATWQESADPAGVHDLTAYEAIWRTPVSTTYRGAKITGMPAPSSAGVTIAEMLNILEGFDLPAAGQSSADRFHLVAEAQKLAWRDRSEYLADPAFTPTPEHLTSKTYAEQLRALIDPARAQSFDPVAATAEGDNTHNLAVIDKWGNAAAINCSIEQAMGSAVVALGTGFLLNNQLTDFDNVAGHVNRPEPRKRPRSSQAPMIATRAGQPVLVTGGIGGPNIIAATANVALNVLDFGQDLAHAVDAERGEARGNCPGSGLQLCLEDARISASTLTSLRERGHDVKNFRALWDGLCSAPPSASPGACEYALLTFNQAAGFDPDDGRTHAATDPRLMAAGNATTAQAAVAQPDQPAKRKLTP